MADTSAVIDKDKRISKLEKKLLRWKEKFVSIQGIIQEATKELSSSQKEIASLKEKINSKDVKIKELRAAIRVSKLPAKGQKRKLSDVVVGGVDGNKKTKKPEIPPHNVHENVRFGSRLLKLYDRLTNPQSWSVQEYARICKTAADDIYTYANINPTENQRKKQQVINEIVTHASLFYLPHLRLALTSLVSLLSKDHRFGQQFLVDFLDSFVANLFVETGIKCIAYDTCSRQASVLSCLLKRVDDHEKMYVMSFWEWWLFPEINKDIMDIHFQRERKTIATIAMEPPKLFPIQTSTTILGNAFIQRVMLIKGFQDGYAWEMFAKAYPVFSKTIQFIFIRRASFALRDCVCVRRSTDVDKPSASSCRACSSDFKEMFWKEILCLFKKEFDGLLLDRDSLSKESLFSHVRNMVSDIVHMYQETDTNSLSRFLWRNSEGFCSLKLLSRDMGWVWTHDVLICSCLWPMISDTSYSKRVYAIRLIGILVKETHLQDGSGILCKYVYVYYVTSVLKKLLLVLQKLNQIRRMDDDLPFQEAVICSLIDVASSLEAKIDDDVIVLEGSYLSVNKFSNRSTLCIGKVKCEAQRCCNDVRVCLVKWLSQCETPDNISTKKSSSDESSNAHMICEELRSFLKLKN